MKKFISLFATSMLLLLSASTAYAIPISGVINFTGGATVTYTDTEVTAIDFNNTYVNLADNLVTGDFDGLEGLEATFESITTSDVTPYNFWTVGTFTFEITSITQNEFGYFTNLGLEYATLGGTGIITSTDSIYEATLATWTVTTNGVTGQDEMSFSSTAIPAPAGAALLGFALLGFGLSRRNKKA